MEYEIIPQIVISNGCDERILNNVVLNLVENILPMNFQCYHVVLSSLHSLPIGEGLQFSNR